MILSKGCLYLYKTADDQTFTEAIPLTKFRYHFDCAINSLWSIALSRIFHGKVRRCVTRQLLLSEGSLMTLLPSVICC